jgi:HEAT repeat protein
LAEWAASGDSAANALETVGPETVAVVAKGLDDANPHVRRETALLLGYLGAHAREAAPALIRALKDENEEVRAMAAKTLRRID